MRFRNNNFNSHIEDFANKMMGNLHIADISRQMNSRSFIDGFLTTFVRSLDMEKNFYFVENSNENVFKNQKILGKDYLNFVYRTNRVLRVSKILDYTGLGNIDYELEFMHQLGAEAGHHLRRETLGDSYVISAPTFTMFVDQSNMSFRTGYEVNFSLNYNEMPKIYEGQYYGAGDPGYGKYYRWANTEIKMPDVFPIITTIPTP
jgi:hypothetical protein